MKLAQEVEKGLELKKHINLIHCSNIFTLVQRKLFNALLFNAYNDLATKNQFTISAKELCEIIGYKSNDYKSLKKALLGLMTIAIEWNVIDYSHNGVERWRASSALSSAKLEKGVCSYEFSLVMKELFFQPEIYGRINLALLPKFKSSYGLALYENCIRYYGIPQTPWFALEVFKKLMGIPENKYPIFRDFKKRVLEIAINEVNSHSPLEVTSDIKRLGRKVISIRFLLKNKQEIKTISNQDDLKNNSLIDTLVAEFGMSQRGINNLFNNYDSNYIEEKVKLILNSDSYREGKITTMPAYLNKALKEDYQQSKPSKLVAEEKRRIKEETERVSKQKTEEMKKLYYQYVTSSINSYVSNLAPEEYFELIKDFETYLKNQGGIGYKWYQKSGMEHGAIKAIFNDYVRNREVDKFKYLITFDEFKKQKLCQAESSV